MLIISKIIFLNLCILLLPTSFGIDDEDYYTLLGVEKSADLRQIRSAFKKLALTKHPDKNKNDPDAHTNFLKLAEAYDILKDTNKRKQYDMHGKKGFESNSSPNYHSYTYYRDQFGIYDDDPHVVTLSNEDFTSSIGDYIWFINFYSPLCSHCHLLANDWRKLSQNLDGVVKIGAVNCEDERNLCWDLQIQQYPSLLFYDETASIYDGVPYSGIRNTENMEKFVMDHLSDIITVPQIKENFVLDESPWVVFIKSKTDYDEPNSDYIRIKLAVVLKGLVSVGYTEDENLIKKLSVRDYSNVIFWKKNEDGSSNLQALTGDDHRSLVEEVLNLLPDIPELTQEDFQTARTALRSGNDIPLLLCFSLSSDSQKAIMLKKLSGTLETFRIGSIDCARSADLCRSLHIARYPTWAILKKGGALEIHSGQSSLHSVERFALDAYEAINIQALSPQDLQRIMAEGSPWIIGWLLTSCSPCKRMLPALRRASNHFTPDVIQFGTVDCAQHSHVCSQYNIRVYPTTAIYNASTVSTYTGEFSDTSIIEFIEAMKLNYVIRLNEDNFQEEIGEKPENILYAVEFYAPWCSPCQQLQPEWLKMAQQLSHLKKIKIGAVDCETYANLCSKEAIRSYPTIRLYPMGSKGRNSIVLYSHPIRNAMTLRNWVMEFFQTHITLLDMANFRQSLLSNREDRTWVVMFFAPWCGFCHQFEPEFLIVTERLKGIIVGGKVDCQKEGALCQQEKIYSYPTVKLYQRIDGVTKINSDIKIEVYTQEALYTQLKAYAAEAYITPVEHDEL